VTDGHHDVFDPDTPSLIRVPTGGHLSSSIPSFVTGGQLARSRTPQLCKLHSMNGELIEHSPKVLVMGDSGRGLYCFCILSPGNDRGPGSLDPYQTP